MLNQQRTEIRRPARQWSGYFNYAFLTGNANLNVTIDHIGKRRDIDFSTGSRITLDEYTRVNAVLQYSISNSVKMFLRLNNLLDEEYEDVFGFEAEEFSGFVGMQVKI